MKFNKSMAGWIDCVVVYVPFGCSFNGKEYSPEEVIENTLAEAKGVTAYYGKQC